MNTVLCKNVGNKFIFIIPVEKNQTLLDISSVTIHSILNVDYSEETNALLSSTEELQPPARDVSSSTTNVTDKNPSTQKKRTREVGIVIRDPSKEDDDHTEVRDPEEVTGKGKGKLEEI
ncbi:uncharacterized protein LOC143887062 [Tasmannia lanceolata]|uniref:uncharacterized protein LOC143887062 n=1 Tax=Tasmannia lanceolata TaxID=3420 RepID=UPI004063C3B4